MFQSILSIFIFFFFGWKNSAKKIDIIFEPFPNFHPILLIIGGPKNRKLKYIPGYNIPAEWVGGWMAWGKPGK